VPFHAGLDHNCVITSRLTPSISRCDFPPAASTTLPRKRFRAKFQATKSPRKRYVFNGLLSGCGDTQPPIPTFADGGHLSHWRVAMLVSDSSRDYGDEPATPASRTLLLDLIALKSLAFWLCSHSNILVHSCHSRGYSGICSPETELVSVKDFSGGSGHMRNHLKLRFPAIA
jgi:hypothetical protein